MLAAVFAILAVLGASGTATALQTVRADPPALRLQIVHLNDFHARFDPVSRKATECKAGDACIGGLARVAAAIGAERARNPDVLVLNAGDNFQGTMWYSLFKWNATAHFMKELPWDALTIGNHEFDDGIAGLTPFLSAFKAKQAPVVIANMDDAKEPSMQGLWAPSVVVEKAGHKIGIVGYIWKDTPTIARTEDLVFTDELEALDKEAARLKQAGVDVIVALTHAGIDVDLDVASKTRFADIIVGAHSHTLLYNGTTPDGEKPYGTYPMVKTQASGRKVLVVQASAYTKYLGNLTVQFDEQGEVVSWDGSNPIYLDSDLPQDDVLVQEMAPWRAEVQALGQRVVGSTLVELDKLTHDCYSGECTLGNFVADAFVHYYAGKGPAGSWTAAAIGFMNAGGLRTNIEPGDITYADLLAAQPFGNTVDLIELQGRHLLDTLEDTVDARSLLQWSGLRVVYDLARPARHRVVSAEVRCAVCEVPRFEAIREDEWYSIAAPSFVVEGGDNFLTLKDNLRNRRIGPVDTDVFLPYLESRSPLTTELDGRITVLNPAQLNAKAKARRMHRSPLIFY